MNYGVYGGFELLRQPNRHAAKLRKEFWEQVEAAKSGLAGASGCYIFALKNGDNIKPWYIGKAECQSFRQECSSPAKSNIFNEVMVDRYGTALLFLLPRLTPSGRLCTVSKNGHSDIDFLESMLIGIALEQNSELANVRKTKLLREMRVPGVINSPQAAPTLPVRDLRNVLGLSS